MKVLALETSTDHLSVAVGWVRGDAGLQQWCHAGPGGSQASASLVPAVLHLLQQADLSLRDLDVIAFGRGPGSFTGLRTACAVAQGLAYGAGLPVLPVDTLLAVAEQARLQLQHTGGQEAAASAPLQVRAVMDARMGEVYHGRFDWDGQRWHERAAAAVCPPECLTHEDGTVLAGNAADVHGEQLPHRMPRVWALPSASALLHLAPALWASGQAVAAEQALPVYVRDKVAQTTAEREALRRPAVNAGVR